MPFNPADRSLTGGPLIELESQDPNTGERSFRINGNLNVRGTILADGSSLAPTLENPLVYKGVIDCSANPNYPAADAGDLYVVSVAGKIGGASGASVEAGDMLICKTDGTLAGTQAQRGASWNIAQSNLLGPIPVKASGAEVDTGTDDAKFVTVKSINDSHNVPMVAPGSDGNVLTSNGTDWVSEAPASGSSYLVYTALLNQNAEDAPVATVLQNTLSGPIVWTYNSSGDYVGTLSAAFTADKTWCMTQQRLGVVHLSRLSANAVSLTAQDGDSVLVNHPVEIRVYP